MKRWGRRLGLNRLYNLALRNPIRDLGMLARDGGPIERERTTQGHAAMLEAAKHLPTIWPPDDNLGYEVHVLTGAKFWHQSAYCVASLQLVSDVRITPVFYSDGSLDETICSALQRVLPWSKFKSAHDIEAQLEEALPRGRFPSLRTRREIYVHLRKLTDIHTFPGGWKMVLDSDLLFYRTPAALIDWFSRPHQIHMIDVVDNYGFPLDYLQSFLDAPLPKRLNVGICGLDSSAIDWERLEYWCARQLTDFGSSYLQEQGLTAMMFAGREAAALPANEYVVMPKIREGKARTAVMHHYVAESKRSYFQHGWREVDRRIREKSVGNL